MSKAASILKAQKNDVGSKGQVQKTNFFKPVIQTKLIINPPGDIYEQEADAVAEKIMRMPASAGTSFFKPKPQPVTTVQRQCAHCEEEENNNVQMKAGSAANGGVTDLPIIHDAINAAGQSMDTSTKNFMESRFGYDFSSVQIHNDRLAHRSSQQINAQAYTHGNHVVFGTGQSQPQSDAGKQLLAHELAHVVQQNSNNIQPKKIQRALGKFARCPANANGSPADPLPEITKANERAVNISLGASHLLFSDSLFMQDPKQKISPNVNFYRQRFGDPVADKKKKFKNRFNNSVHNSLLLAQASEMQFLSDRLKKISDFLNGSIHFQCSGTGSITLGDCSSAKCKPGNVLISCPTKKHGREMAVCSGFWTKSLDEKAIGITHEAAHMLFRFGDRDTAPYADTAAKRRKEPECYTSLIADIYGITPFDPSCPAMVI